MNKILEVRKLFFSFNDKEILKNISFDLNKGDVLSLVGKNGCGKTTLLKLLLGIYKSKNTIKIYDKYIEEYTNKDLAKLISYVPQTHQIPFDYKVLDVVLMGRLAHLNFFSSYSKKDIDICKEALKKIKASYLEDKIYSRISGGERQLVFIARALAQESKIIFMDEPVTGLDYGNQFELLKLIKSLAKEGYTFIKTTHYPEHALYSSNKVLMIKDKEVLDFGNTDEKLNSSNIEKLYKVEVKILNEGNYKFCIPKI